MEALLSSLIAIPKSVDRFYVSPSFHFQCIKKLVFSAVVLQLGKIILSVLVFKIKEIPVAGFHSFSAHQNILAFWLNFGLLFLLFSVIISWCKCA